MLFKSVIITLIEYGDILYEGTTMKHLDDIAGLFYRGVRICCHSDGNLSKT